uniref:Uncharacterized protein n=1 Tax=Glossina brevipalpis TaxID=37001 RepID=A0A1A9W678_9MUSC
MVNVYAKQHYNIVGTIHLNTVLLKYTRYQRMFVFASHAKTPRWCFASFSSVIQLPLLLIVYLCSRVWVAYSLCKQYREKNELPRSPDYSSIISLTSSSSTITVGTLALILLETEALLFETPVKVTSSSSSSSSKLMVDES